VQGSVVRPSVVQPSVVQPSVVQPSVVQPSVVQLSVVQLSVVRPSVVQLSVVRPSVVQLKMNNSKNFKSLISDYDGEINKYFTLIGGHQVFLERYAELLEISNLSLLDELNDFEGTRYPENFDVGTKEKTFSWFFHYHDNTKVEKGHFHLYGSPKVFDDPTAFKKTHIISIELTEHGDFAGFFVPNQWVTDDHVRPAKDIAEILSNFHTFNNDHSANINIWLTAIIREFNDVIMGLLNQRDIFLGNMSPADKETYLSNKKVEKICERGVQ
jgi:hypothetical protein